MHGGRRNDEVEALHDVAVGSRERHEGQHAEHLTERGDHGAAAVAPRRGGVGLDHAVPGDVLLEARDRAAGHGRFDLGRGVEQLVAQDHAGEAEDVNPVADLRARGIRERQRRHIGGLELEKREIPAGHRLADDRSAVLRDLCRNSHAVGQHDVERRRELDRCAADGRVERAGGELAARLAHASLRQLALDRRRRPLRRRDHVGIGDHPAPRAHEPARARLAERLGRDGDLRPSGAPDTNLGCNLDDDERHGRLRPE